METDFLPNSTNYMSGAYIGSFYIIYWLVMLTIIGVIIAAKWKIYQKADCNGWAALIPFYNDYVMYEVATGNGILFLLGYIPLVSIVMKFYIAYKLAKAFGKDIGYTLGLIFFSPIFYCILGFGEAEYIGPE